MAAGQSQHACACHLFPVRMGTIVCLFDYISLLVPTSPLPTWSVVDGKLRRLSSPVRPPRSCCIARAGEDFLHGEAPIVVPPIPCSCTFPTLLLPNTFPVPIWMPELPRAMFSSRSEGCSQEQPTSLIPPDKELSSSFLGSGVFKPGVLSAKFPS